MFYATGFIGYFYILTFIIGFGAILLVSTNPDFRDATGALLGGTNMAAVHLADAVGGSLFLGFISAVAFATILAVVAGLTLAGASAVSHDLYACVIKQGKVNETDELRVSKMTTLVLGSSPSAWASCSRSRTSPSWWAWPSPSRRAATSCALPLHVLVLPDHRGAVMAAGSGW